MVVLATALGHSIANTDWKTLLLVEDPGELPRTVAVVAVAVAVAAAAVAVAVAVAVAAAAVGIDTVVVVGVVGTVVAETVAGGCTIVVANGTLVLAWARNIVGVVAGACHFCSGQRTPEGVDQNPIAKYH